MCQALASSSGALDLLTIGVVPRPQVSLWATFTAISHQQKPFHICRWFKGPGARDLIGSKHIEAQESRRRLGAKRLDFNQATQCRSVPQMLSVTVVLSDQFLAWKPNKKRGDGVSWDVAPAPASRPSVK